MKFSDLISVFEVSLCCWTSVSIGLASTLGVEVENALFQYLFDLQDI